MHRAVLGLVLAWSGLAAAEPVIPDGATCIPKALRPTVGHENHEQGPLDLQLGLVDGTPTLCATSSIGTVACWQVDTKKKRLVPIPARLLPGLPVATELDAGCTQGYCLPKGTTLPDDARPMLAINDTGELTAILVIHDMQHVNGYLFETATKKPLRTFTLDAQDFITRMIFVGDRIATQTCKAAAHCNFSVFSTTAPTTSTSLTVKGKDFTNGHLGMLTLLAPGTIGFADVGWFAFGRFDTTTNTVATVRTKKPSKCAHKAIHDFEPGACARKELDPFADAYMIATGTTYLARLAAPRSGDLVTYDAKLGQRAQFSAYCR